LPEAGRWAFTADISIKLLNHSVDGMSAFEIVAADLERPTWGAKQT
jgi:hypothetical protein